MIHFLCSAVIYLHLSMSMSMSISSSCMFRWAALVTDEFNEGELRDPDGIAQQIIHQGEVIISHQVQISYSNLHRHVHIHHHAHTHHQSSSSSLCVCIGPADEDIAEYIAGC